MLKYKNQLDKYILSNKSNGKGYTMNEPKILIIEDDPVIVRTNRKALEMQGYRVLCADTITKGRFLVRQEMPDLILLDVLLPDGNGLDYSSEIRGSSSIPILFLSALGTNANILDGLRAGGDDYITKPYDLDILLAKVEAILRRCSNLESYKYDFLCMGNLRLDLYARRAYLNNDDLLLKPKEFAVLEVLIRQDGVPISSSELYERLWALDTAGDTRTVWVHISTLRSKLGDPEQTGSVYLLSGRNGYFLCLNDA